MPEEYENVVESAQDTITERHEEMRKEERPKWLEALALSTALFAVLAAFASLKAGDSANEALFNANNAVLQQSKAVDVWSQFQADSVKKYLASSSVILLPHVGGTAAEINAAKAEIVKRQKAQDELKIEAMKLDSETKKLSEESKVLLARHVKYALGVTLFQVSIGLAAIATLVRRRELWLGSLVVGVAGTVALIVGFTIY
ncbi:DUF4337 family protein (plasmid) [Deinococcus radiomollis]|uniref:DUF4337 family protein n=1 Tax=Deinococcus radiomollis TaxID=468916 RepID=UPI003892285B